MMNKNKTISIIKLLILIVSLVLGFSACATLSEMVAANLPPKEYGVLTIENKTQHSINRVDVKGVYNSNFTNSYQVNIRSGGRAEIGEPLSDYKAVVLPVGRYEVVLYFSDGSVKRDTVGLSNEWAVSVYYTTN